MRLVQLVWIGRDALLDSQQFQVSGLQRVGVRRLSVDWGYDLVCGDVP